MFACMVTRHAKSSCCGAPIQHFGGRRRRCPRCGRTWRIRRCRRGPKPGRPALALLRATLLERRSLARQAAARRCPAATLRRRCRQALAWFLAHSAAAPVPPGAVILLGDALWLRFGRARWTLYLLAAKPRTTPTAIVLDPLLLPGREAQSGWLRAVAQLPAPLRQRVKAFVSDGFPGSNTLARGYGWVHQRCHFHLIAKLQARRGRRTRMRGWQGREAIYQAAREALRTRSPARLRQLRRELRALAHDQPYCPARLRMTVADLLAELPAFRAYQAHPALHLPTTTNALEAMAKILRARLRPLRTPEAVQRWATALIRLRPYVTCNGHDHQPK